MRSTCRLLTLALLAVSAFVLTACNRGPAGAGSNAKVQIKSVQIGIKPGPVPASEDSLRRAPLFKAGHWTPVVVEIEGKGKLENAELVVEVIDADDVLNNYRTKLPVLEFSAEQPTHTLLTYARPGKIDGPINVSVRSKEGQNLCPPNEQTPYGLEPSSFLYVTLGSRLPRLRIPGGDDKNRSEVAAIDNPAELPTKWFGYQTADLVILTTGRKDFTSGLFDDDARRTALLEWVRRGGKLVISCGENQQDLTRQSLESFLPVEFGAITTPERLQISWGDASGMQDALERTERTVLTVVPLKPKTGRGVRTPVPVGLDNSALVAQAPYGLGRITLVGMDLDKGPFVEWKGQKAFWEKLLKESGPSFPTQQSDQDAFAMSRGNYQVENDEVQVQLQRGLETFDGVPIISFGWVALFILIYILVVGPLDYFFLKKVVKRLELTWITFPLVVVLVSAAAYFSAYAIKGDDQKINKLDLIDIDLQTRTAHGSTWFSIFSPRIQNYTIGVEPFEGWGYKKDSAIQPHVSWLGTARKGRQSLFRRSYDYAADATGLERVPIQVWSTKGFQATWQAPLEDRAEPIRPELQRVGADLAGGITSNLPVTLNDAVVFFRGKAYRIGTLRSGAKVVINPSSTMQAENWFEFSATNFTYQSGPKSGPVVANPEPSRSFIKSLMFNESREKRDRKGLSRNGGLRELDESWRLRPEDPGNEAVLVGRVDFAAGDAEDVSNQKATITRLWLGSMPGARREKIIGSLRQESYVRVYLPVAESKK
jgi:predicted small secreted protein